MKYHEKLIEEDYKATTSKRRFQQQGCITPDESTYINLSRNRDAPPLDFSSVEQGDITREMIKQILEK